MSTMAQNSRTAAMRFILVTVFLDALTFGLAIPVGPELVKSLGGGDTAAASHWVGLLLAAFAAAQFLFAPLLGALSDHFGRRPVLLLSIFGAGLNQLVTAFAPSLGWLLLGRVLAGATAANMSAANAYVADITAPAERARNFGLVGAAVGLGLIAGPALGGFLGHLDLRLPFLTAAALAALNFLYGMIVLPESLAAPNRRAFSWRKASPVGVLGMLGRNATVSCIAGLSCCAMLAFGMLQAVWVLHTGSRFGWTTMDNGLALTFVGLASALAQGGLVAVAVRRLGERKAITGALCIASLGYITYGLAPNGWIFASAILPHAVGGITGPAAQGVVTRAVGRDEQGRLQGALASLNSLVFIAGPLLGAALFSAASAADIPVPLRGAPFLFGAFLLLLAIPLALKALRHAPPPGGLVMTAQAGPHAPALTRPVLSDTNGQ